jgi:hypothetical protein
VKRLPRGAAIGFGIAAMAAILATSGSASSDAGMIRFEGHGVRALPTFRVDGPSTLIWTHSGSFFQISSSGDYCYDGAVTSNADHGATSIPAGVYRNLRVRAVGTWTVAIRAGVERLGSPIRFSGSGERELPPFRLRSGRTMYWTNTGDRFQTIPLEPNRSGVVSSGGRRGHTHLRAGRYRLVVDAVVPDEPIGNWTITIR